MVNNPATNELSLSGRHVLLGVCGGIAAYRACELARDLQRAGATVQCILTAHAAQFVTPLTFEALTGQPALVNEFPSESGTAAQADVYAHLNLTRRIDAFVIAPLTASTLADLAAGRAAELLTACYLSNEAPVVLAPAMNTRMWHHQAVQANVAVLAQRGHTLVPPESGSLACGDEGPGRLAALDNIVAAVVKAIKGAKPAKPLSALTAAALPRVETRPSVAFQSQRLAGQRYIVTGGGTREYLDPVRFITNASTGTLALAIAEALLDEGAEVDLVASELYVQPELARRLSTRDGVRTAFDMQQAISESLPKADGLIMFAAVADYTPAKYSAVKRKKDGGSWTVELTETPDILKSLAGMRQAEQVVVAVSLEDEDWLARSVKKAAAKHVNLMLAVELGADLPFGDRKLHCALFEGENQLLTPARRDKQEVAAAIADWLARRGSGRSANKEN